MLRLGWGFYLIPTFIKWWVFCCKEPTEPRAIMQLVHNPHMPHYRWHLTCLTNYGVIRQFSTHLFQPVDPMSPPSKAHWRRLVPVCIPPTRHFNCTNSNKPMCLWWRRRVLPPRPVQSSIRIIKLYPICYHILGGESREKWRIIVFFWRVPLQSSSWLWCW